MFTLKLNQRFYSSLRLTALLALACAALWSAHRSTTSQAAEPDQTNLLQNGGFESGNVGLGLTAIPGWTVVRGTVDVLANSPNSGLPWQHSAEGAQSLDLIGTPGVASLRQSFTTEVGRKYVFSGWVSHHYGVGEASANVSLNGVLLAPLYHNTPNAQGDL